MIKYQAEIIEALTIHLQITFIALVLAISIGIPFGVVVSKNKILKQVIMLVINSVQAIPSLALLGMLIPLLGIGFTPAIVMTFIYSILPIVKNTSIGIETISPEIQESAESLGLSKLQKLIRIELPLAFPVIIAGIRITAVSAVGLVTIAALIGAGGLGTLIYSGIQTFDNELILSGAIPAVLLTLLFDYGLSQYEKNIVKHKTKKRKQKRRVILGVLIFTVGTTVVYQQISNSAITNKEIVVASKPMTESAILAEMMKIFIEEKTNLNVVHKMNMGTTSIILEGMKRGDIDIYPEYTGTLYLEYLNNSLASNDTKDTVFAKTKDAMKQVDNIEILPSLGFNNTYAIAIRHDIATQYNITTISELSKYSPMLSTMTTIDFQNRSDGYDGLVRRYNLRFKDVKQGNDIVRYQALNNNNVQIVDAFSTDAAIKEFNLKLLKDDQGYFPPYYAIPVIQGKTLEKYPELRSILEKLNNILTDNEMIDLNYQVLNQKKTPRNVAREFLQKKNLI